MKLQLLLLYSPVLLSTNGGVLTTSQALNSMFRKHIFPDNKARFTPAVIMLVEVPWSVIEADPGTDELWNDDPCQLYFGPDRSTVAWRMTYRQVYLLQMCDFEYGASEKYAAEDPPDAPYITQVTDLSGLQQR